MSAQRLRITEIFYSLQGEGLTSGVPTVFVRLTGCPLRCTYCDTAYAFSGGEWMSFKDILGSIQSYDCNTITITGGEPLAQAAVADFMTQLCDKGYQVSLETSGALDVAAVDPRVSKVVDIKTPASGEEQKNLWSNLEHVTAHDQIKFVICDKDDYEWSKQILLEKRLSDKCSVIFSPAWQQIDLAQLSQWILNDHLPVRMQVQLHKVIWGDEPGR